MEGNCRWCCFEEKKRVQVLKIKDRRVETLTCREFAVLWTANIRLGFLGLVSKGILVYVELRGVLTVLFRWRKDHI